MDYRRYQRGSVYKRGKRGRQVWVAMWREGEGESRRQRKKVLGTIAEMPNRQDALDCLATLMRQRPTTRLTFAELVEKWKVIAVPTFDKESTAANYRYNLNHYLVPVFGKYDILSFCGLSGKLPSHYFPTIIVGS